MDDTITLSPHPLRVPSKKEPTARDLFEANHIVVAARGARKQSKSRPRINHLLSHSTPQILCSSFASRAVTNERRVKRRDHPTTNVITSSKKLRKIGQKRYKISPPYCVPATLAASLQDADLQQLRQSNTGRGALRPFLEASRYNPDEQFTGEAI